MRTFIAAFLLAALAQPVTAQPGNVKTDPMNEPNAEMSAESEVIMMLQEFTKKLEEAGFKDIQLSQGLILQAKDKFDKPILMLVDPETMVGMQLNAQPENETTGSVHPTKTGFRANNKSNARS
jgi:hypothetical protein